MSVVGKRGKHLGFTFGENWEKYSENISPLQIKSAESGLTKLLTKNAILNKEILDIGSGSGIHGLSFLNLGARKVVCFDVDPKSVSTTEKNLRNWPEKYWSVYRFDILNDNFEKFRKFDVVYSWGFTPYWRFEISA